MKEGFIRKENGIEWITTIIDLRLKKRKGIKMEKKEMLITYKTEKITGNSSNIVEIFLKRVDGLTWERKIYRITPLHLGIGGYIVHVYPKKKTIRVLKSLFGNISYFADELNYMYQKGRILYGYNKRTGSISFSPLDEFIGRVITYRQVKTILRFERNASKNGVKHEAIEKVDPTLLPKFLDFGDYAIEVWKKPQKRMYSYITDSETSKKWLDKLIG